MTLPEIADRLEAGGQWGIAAELRAVIPLYTPNAAPSVPEAPPIVPPPPEEAAPGVLERAMSRVTTRAKPHAR
jgi:hypothetical protein